MSAKDLLKAQYHFFYYTVKANLTDMGPEESLAQPSPGGNCANWILGHLLGAHNAAMGLVDEAPAWENPALAELGAGPITSADDAIDWETLVRRFVESEGRFMRALDGLDDARLDDEGFTDPFGNEVTRGELLNLLAVHGHYHAGQLGVVRRIAGLPGAIGDPQRRAAKA